MIKRIYMGQEISEEKYKEGVSRGIVPVMPSTMPGIDSRICLNMIVKDEAKIIGKALASVAPFITHFEICDTGSTDDTVKIILDYFDSKGIPGNVHHTRFEDYSQARNEALLKARESEGSFGYILLMDADMTLHVTPVERDSSHSAIGAGGGDDEGYTDIRFSGLQLDGKHAYKIRQKGSTESYDNVRLVRRDVPAMYVLETHEYLNTPSISVNDMTRIEEVYFIDHQSGSGRSKKYERDEMLLKRALARDSRNVRAMFYLAQTYREMNRFPEADRWYRMRVDHGGWDEEVWYAQFQRGVCLLSWAENDPKRKESLTEEAVSVLLQAFQMRPTRIESLHKLANHFRHQGKNEIANIFLERAKLIPHSKDMLFVNDFAYTHGLKEEIGIAGFYSADAKIREQGYQACCELSLDRSAPRYIRDTARRNLGHYAKSLSELLGNKAFVKNDGKTITAKPFNNLTQLHIQETLVCKLCQMQIPFSGANVMACTAAGGLHDWQPLLRPSNPSVFFEGPEDGNTRLFVNVRKVNYFIKPDGSYDSDGTIRTENEIQILDRSDLSLIRRLSLVDRTTDSKNTGNIRGYEDIRLFSRRGKLYGLCTVLDRHEKEGWAEMALLYLEEKDTTIHVIECRRLKGPNPHNSREKNWVPILRIDDDDLPEIIYSNEPSHIMRIGSTDGTIAGNLPAFALDHLRGSSQAIPFLGRNDEKGFLYLTHEVIENTPRTYLHRFVWADTELVPRFVSEPFYLKQKGIEFCAGLAENKQTGALYISFGVMDREAYLLEVSGWAVFDLLFGGKVS